MAKKLRKQLARLKERQDDFDRRRDQNERTRPGSMNRKKR